MRYYKIFMDPTVAKINCYSRARTLKEKNKQTNKLKKQYNNNKPNKQYIHTVSDVQWWGEYGWKAAMN